MDYITLKKSESIKRFGIRTEDGKDTGEYIEIDLEDIELPLKVSECESKHFDNRKMLDEKIKAAEQKANDTKDGKLLSEKQKAILEAINEYYQAEEDALDYVLGKGGTKKLLNGRKPYYRMYDDINEYLEQIIPELKLTSENLKKSIQAKYKTEKEDNIL